VRLNRFQCDTTDTAASRCEHQHGGKITVGVANESWSASDGDTFDGPVVATSLSPAAATIYNNRQNDSGDSMSAPAPNTLGWLHPSRTGDAQIVNIQNVPVTGGRREVKSGNKTEGSHHRSGGKATILPAVRGRSHGRAAELTPSGSPQAPTRSLISEPVADVLIVRPVLRPTRTVAPMDATGCHQQTTAQLGKCQCSDVSVANSIAKLAGP